MKKIQSVRGMNDIVGDEAWLFQAIIQQVNQLFTAYQFEPMVLPVVEKTELFSRGIGQATDIIEKEMYTFPDRNEESVSLRPEGTAGCVRACLNHGLIHNQVRKFWYCGPMFRYEAPQKGRYRQFYQIGAEVFGIASPDIEAEIISMLHQLWDKLGVLTHVQLEINTIGTLEERRLYRQALVDYLAAYKEELDADSQRRLQTNPLRILDSKNPKTQAILENAPKLRDCLGKDSSEHFARFTTYLDQLNISYIVNPRLVRGLDYYSHTVFEWTTDLLGAQATVCAGGRYDGLVSQLGGQATAAFGFAMGLERLILLAEQTEFRAVPNKPLAYIMTEEDKSAPALHLAQKLRNEGITVALNCGGGSVKSQYKRAYKTGAAIALLPQGQNNDALLFELEPIKQGILPELKTYDALVTLLQEYKNDHG